MKLYLISFSLRAATPFYLQMFIQWRKKCSLSCLSLPNLTRAWLEQTSGKQAYIQMFSVFALQTMISLSWPNLFHYDWDKRDSYEYINSCYLRSISARAIFSKVPYVKLFAMAKTGSKSTLFGYLQIQCILIQELISGHRRTVKKVEMNRKLSLLCTLRG